MNVLYSGDSKTFFVNYGYLSNYWFFGWRCESIDRMRSYVDYGLQFLKLNSFSCKTELFNVTDVVTEYFSMKIIQVALIRLFSVECVAISKRKWVSDDDDLSVYFPNHIMIERKTHGAPSFFDDFSLRSREMKNDNSEYERAWTFWVSNCSRVTKSSNKDEPHRHVDKDLRYVSRGDCIIWFWMWERERVTYFSSDEFYFDRCDPEERRVSLMQKILRITTRFLHDDHMIEISNWKISSVEFDMKDIQ